MTASSGSTLSFQSLKNRSAISGATSSSYTISSVKATDAGSYSVNVINAYGTTPSSSATLTVTVPPTITTQPASQTVISGNSASFSVVASGTAPLTYQWNFGGANISGATSSSYGISSVNTNNAGSYSVNVINAYGTVTSSAATLTVTVPPTITAQPQNQTVILNQNVFLSVAASGTAPFGYQWQATNTARGGFTNLTNGGQISGANTNVLAIANIMTNDALFYRVIITNAVGAVTSSPAILAVSPAILTVIPPILVDVQFLGTPGSTWPYGTGSPQTGAAILGASGDNWNQEGMPYYIYPGTSTNINAATLVNSANAASGFTLTVGSPTNSVFSGHEVNAAAADPVTTNLMSSAIQQFVLATNLDTWTITVGGLSGYTGDQFNLVVYAGAPGARTQTISLSGGASGGNTASNLTTTSTSLQLSAGIGVAYNMFTNGTLNGSNLVFTVNGGTAGVDTYAAFVNGFQLQIFDSPVIMAQPASQTNTAGSTVQFSVEASGEQLIYQWQATNTASGGFTNLANGGQISGANTNVLAIANVITNNALFYRVIITNRGGAVTSSPASLTVYPNNILIDGDIGSGATQTGAAVLGSPGNVWNTITNASGTLVSSAGAALGGIGFTLTNAAQLYLAANGTPTDFATTNLMEDYAFGYTNSGYTRTITTSITGLTLYTNSAFVLVVYAAGNQAGQGGILALNGATGGNTSRNLTTTAASRQISAGVGVAYNIFYGILTNGTLTVTSTRTPGQAFTIMNGFQLELSPLPMITAQPTSQTNANGNTASFTVGAFGTGILSYQWQAGPVGGPYTNLTNGGQITGSVSNVLTISSLTANWSGGYQVIISNNGGSVTSTPAMLTLPPQILTQPVSQATASGSSASFNVVAAGSAPLSYQWYFDGAQMGGGSSSSTLSLSAASTNNAGNYFVVVANSYGSTTSAVATLTVYPPPTVTMQPQSLTVTQGLSATFSVAVSGTPPFGYQWQFVGANLAGATNATLVVTNVQLVQAGNYCVTVANPAGAVTSSAALLIVVPPTITNLPTWQDLVVHLTFDTNLLDSSGRGNHAFAVGSPNFVPGFIGAQAFNPYTGTNGSTNFASFGTPPDLFFGVTNDFSLAFWARLPTNAWSGSSYFEPPFICNKNFETYASVGWTLAAGPGGRFEWNYSEGTPTNYFGPGGTFGNPVWHHLAVTFQRAGNGIAYVDGVPVSTNSLLPGGQTIDSGLPTNLGNDGTGDYPSAYGYFTNVFGIPTNGLALDDLGIWRRALLPTEISAIYNAGLAGQALSTVTAARLTTSVLPRITQQPTNTTALTGSAPTFTVTASGPSPFGCQWYGNGIALAGANAASLTLSNVQPAQAGGYYVVLTNSAASVTSAVAILIVDAPPTITSQPQSQGVANGQNVSFSVAASGTGPFTYQWYLGTSQLGGSTSSNLTVNNVNPNNAGNYTAVVNNNYGSITSAVATLTVYVLPGIQTQPQNQTVLQGQTAAFTVVTNNNGTPPFSYQWNVNGTNTVDGLSISGSTNATLTLSNVQPAQAGNVFVVITNNAGSITSSLATLTVNVPATITNQPLSQAVLAGQTTTFSVGATGTPNLRYQWYFNGAQMGGGSSSSTLSLSAVGTNNAGNYTVVVNNNYGSATSAVATLTVYVPPAITTQPTNQALVLGQNATFAVVALGTPTLTYQWNCNGTNLAGATNTLLTLTNIQTAAAASYSVVVSNNYGSATSAVATLTVYLPTTITTQPQSQGAPQGQNVAFSVGVSGTGPFTYQWYFGTSALGGPQTATNSINNVGPGSAGSYSVVVTGAGGSVTSVPAILIVYVLPGIQNQPQNQTVLQGQTATFTVVTNNNGTPPFSYQWNVNGTNTVDGLSISGSTNATLTLSNVQPAQAGNVFVVITNNAGSITSSLATLTVNVPATITNQPLSQAVLAGQTTTFSVGATGTPNLRYQWYFNGAQMGGGSSSSTLSLSAVGTNNAGNYTVVVNNNYGSATSAVATLTVYVPPAITTQPTNQALVLGQNATFAVVALGTPTLTYQWNCNGTNLAGATNTLLTLTNIQTAAAASYSVVVSNNYGSATSAVATLTVYLPTTITTQPQSQGAPQGQNVAFSVGVSGTGPFTYQWYFGTSALGGPQTATNSINNVGPGSAGSYSVVVTGAGGSVTSVPAILIVYVLPGIQNQPQNQTVLQGQTATFTVVTNNNGTPPFSYQWNVNGTNTVDGLSISGSTNATLTLSNVQPAQAGNVFVVITNNAGSITSSLATLTVNVPAYITNQPVSQAVIQGQTATFAVGAGGTPNLSYQWYFKGAKLDGGQSQNATLSLSAVGTNNAGHYKVVVDNNYGAVTSVVVTLSVLIPPSITNQPQSQILAIGQTATFQTGATGAAPLDYQWFFNGAAMPGATNPSCKLTGIHAANAGSYAVVVTNLAGSVTSAAATLTVTNPVIALSVATASGSSLTFQRFLLPSFVAGGDHLCHFDFNRFGQLDTDGHQYRHDWERSDYGRFRHQLSGTVLPGAGAVIAATAAWSGGIFRRNGARFSKRLAK